MATLDLNQLRSFVAIADCGGFGRAAAALHLSQPTISGHVRLLERVLGRQLVLKEGRTARFTDAGEQLLAEARRLLAAHDQAIGRLGASRREQVAVGLTETAADQVLPGLLGHLGAAFPGSRARFHIDRSTQLTSAVDRGAIDLAVILALDDAPGRRIGSLPLGWFSSPQWRAPASGDAYPLVAYAEPCGMRRQALTELADAGLPVDVVAESTSLEGVIAAARADLGVAVLPCGGTAPAGLVQRHDLPDLGRIGVHLATRRGLDLDLEEAALGAAEAFFARTAGFAPAGSHPSTIAMDTDRRSLLDSTRNDD